MFTISVLPNFCASIRACAMPISTFEFILNLTMCRPNQPSHAITDTERLSFLDITQSYCLLLHYPSQGFAPQSRSQLKSHIESCVRMLPNCDCTISRWDVSSVRDMSSMFQGARSFDGDISNWDVSRVISMRNMFRNAGSFKRDLCGTAWSNSKAIKTDMFAGSSGSISTHECISNIQASRLMCTSTRRTSEVDKATASFQVDSNADLKRELGEYLKLSPKGDCTGCSRGPIGDWDVSRVTDMSELFSGANLFNADISKWDVSRVTNMNRMFMGATSFQGDLSKWDVSSVTDMTKMFSDASAFNSDISNWDVSKVEQMTSMFAEAKMFDDKNGCKFKSVPNENPFLDQAGLPRFQAMRSQETITKYLDVAITTSLAEMQTNFAELERKIEAKEIVSSSDIMDELARVIAKLSYAWRVAGHLIHVRARQYSVLDRSASDAVVVCVLDSTAYLIVVLGMRLLCAC